MWIGFLLLLRLWRIGIGDKVAIELNPRRCFLLYCLQQFSFQQLTLLYRAATAESSFDVISTINHSAIITLHQFLD